MPSTEAVRILLVSANPPNSETLASDVEARQVDDALWNSLQRERFALHHLTAARIGDLARSLRRYRPHILHIAVHGTEGGGLNFNDPEDWEGQTLSAADLARIVAAYQAEATEKLRLVVLAGCGTASAAQLLCSHVECVIGTTDDISDGAVLRFSPAFYAALGDGRSIGNAHDSGLAELHGHGWKEDAARIQLCARPGVDVHSLHLGDPPRSRLSELHLEYLRRWFGRPWAAVNLADISPRQERASLLDVYVPLPVDFELDIEVKDHRIVEWWVHGETPETRRGGLQPPDVADELAAIGHAIEPAKERVWADLGVGEAELQKIVERIQEKIDERKDDWAYRWDQTHTWPLEAEHAASVQPRFVLLGEPGGGKSSFLRHLALCLAGELRRRAGDEDVPVNASLQALRDWLLDAYTPVYIELRELAASHFPPLPQDEQRDAALPGIDDFWAYVRESVLGPGLAAFEGELRTLCRGGGAILLLDGLDEIPQAGDKRRRAQVKGFVAALTGVYPRLRVIVSGRPHAYRRGEWALDGFGRAELEPLLPSRLYELAQALFRIVTPEADGDEAAAFIEAVEETPHIEKGLHRNPLFFTLLAALWLNPDAPRRLPATRADLYRQAVDLLLGRWTRRRAPDPSVAEGLGIAPEHLRPVLESLACTVTEQSQPGQDTTLFAGEVLDAILRRARLRVVPLDISDYLSQHAGILVEQASDEFAFVHRSFQEHLAACELTCPQPDKRKPSVPAERRFPQGIARRVIERPDLWENVARLAADELVAQKRESDLWRLLVEMARPYLTAQNQKSDFSEKSDFSAGTQAAFLVLEIVRQHNLFAVERDEFDPLAHSFGLLRRVAETALIDHENFEPEQRLIAGQLLGSRPGLDTRTGVGVVETRHGVSLPDIDWVKIDEADENGQREFIYQDDERRVEPTFWMARYPITYAQFQCFIDADDGWRNSEWWKGLALNDQNNPGEQNFPVWNHPRENVSWYQAIAFCRWLTAQARRWPELLPPEAQGMDGWRISLPTEWQWEKAARGYDGRKYPWDGDTYQPGYANVDEITENAGPHYLQTTSAVGMYPQGASPYGVLDLSGNVWEWCLNEYDNPNNCQEIGSKTRVVRGGGWDYAHDDAAAAARDENLPYYWYLYGYGFRVVWSASVPVA